VTIDSRHARIHNHFRYLGRTPHIKGDLDFFPARPRHKCSPLTSLPAPSLFDPACLHLLINAHHLSPSVSIFNWVLDFNDKVMLSLVHSEDKLFYCRVTAVSLPVRADNTISQGHLKLARIYTRSTFHCSWHNKQEGWTCCLVRFILVSFGIK
jgi:hypothetical protein